MWILSVKGFGMNTLAYECDSMVCVVGSSRPLEHVAWLVPYECVAAGQPLVCAI